MKLFKNNDDLDKFMVGIALLCIHVLRAIMIVVALAAVCTVLSLFTSCRRPVVPAATNTITSTFTERIRDTFIPPASVSAPVPIIQPGQTVYRPYVITDTTGRAALSFYRDAYGQLVARCEATEQRLAGALVERTSTAINKEAVPLAQQLRSTWQELPWWLRWAAVAALFFQVTKPAHEWIRRRLPW